MNLEERIVNRMKLGTERERFVATAAEIARLLGLAPQDTLLCYDFKEKDKPHVLPELFISPGTSPVDAARTTHSNRATLFTGYQHTEGSLSLVLATPIPIQESPEDQTIQEACSSESFKDMQRAAFTSYRKEFMNPETRFPNRSGLRHFFEQTAYRNQFRGFPGRKDYIIFMDLNKFKAVNDNLGHNKGNEVLRTTEQILVEASEQLPHNSTYIARIGGDEYVFAGAATEEEIEQITGHVQERLQQQIIIGPHIRTGELTQAKISAAYGIAQYSGDDRFEDVMKLADKMMYEAKEAATGERRRIARSV